MIDIVIPVLNEEKILLEKESYYNRLRDKARLIFADGGSRDRTVEIAKTYGDVFVCPQGRALQKNHGARSGSNDILLFLHVDCQIDPRALAEIDTLLGSQNKFGFFKMKICDCGLLFRMYERIVNFRGQYFGVLDGDLGLFIQRSAFDDLEGFDLLPIMEDLEFSKKLRKQGKGCVSAFPIYVSSRRWKEKGFICTFIRYTLAYLQLWTGIKFFKGVPVDQAKREDSINHLCS